MNISLSAKKILASVIYRYPPVGLQPERVGIYIYELLQRLSLAGDIVEVGCNLGGTSICAFKAMTRSGWNGEYHCFDTFEGFVPSQFGVDAGLGTPIELGKMFEVNDIHLVSKILNLHDCGKIKLHKGDISRTPPVMIPKKIIAALIDVDLSEPTFDALELIYPNLVEGGIIFVDDCPENYSWKARVGYEKFCDKYGLEKKVIFGLGVVEKNCSALI
jgi:hypothetical protein